MTISHHPVLLQEVLEGLALKSGAVVLDATVGLGGHSEAILRAVGPSGRLIALDRDQQALELTQARLGQYQGQVCWAHGTFAELDRILGEARAEVLDGALLDLGVSALQLEETERGFSFARAGPLDMRMDQGDRVTAGEIVNRTPLPQLRQMLRDWGGERWADRIARSIVERRPLHTTAELAEAVIHAVPRMVRHGRIHPATRTFQAIRIAVNRELEMLSEGLGQAIRHLRRDGRIAVLAYHSLEDRIVKTTFRKQAQLGILEIITRKPIRPSAEEISRNPRSRSACLRVARRLPER